MSGYRPKSPKQVILASRTEQENLLLRRKLVSLEDCFDDGVKMIPTRPQSAKLELTQVDPDLIVFNFNDWSREELKSVAEVRGEGYDRMILVLAKSDAPTAVQNLKFMDRVVYVEKPYEARDLVGIAQKAIQQGHVKQRLHRRFNTLQDAEVEFEMGGQIFQSRLFNLSRTGAYLELSTLRQCLPGEPIRLRMELHDVSRTYVMPCEVIWTQPMGQHGGTGLGVKFTGRAEVKRDFFGPG